MKIWLIIQGVVMKPSKLRLVAGIVVLVLVIVTFALVQSQNEKICPGAKLTTSFSVPAEQGMATFQTTTIDDDCNAIAGPVQTVPIEELPLGVINSNTRHSDFQTVTINK